MSTGRMKDQKDYDLEQIVGIIDQALESDDQRIRDALRQLMTITVLCTAEHPDQAIKGPLARIIEDMHNLAKRLSTLEDDVRKLQWDQQKKQVGPYMPTIPTPRPPPFGPTPTPPTSPWVYPNDPTKPTPMWGPSWTSTEVGDLPNFKNWTAGDDPNYKGASASGMLAEDFIKSLEENK